MYFVRLLSEVLDKCQWPVSKNKNSMKEDSWYVHFGRDVLDPESGTGSKGVMGCIHDPTVLLKTEHTEYSCLSFFI